MNSRLKSKRLGQLIPAAGWARVPLALLSTAGSFRDVCVGALVIGLLVLQPTTGTSQESSKKTEVRLPITLEPDQRTELRARVEGYVAKIHVDIGDRVEKGQLLVTLDAPELQADVRRREQMVRQSEAHLAVAKGRVMTAKAKLSQAGSARDEQAALKELRISERNRYATLVRGGAVQREKLEEAEYAVKAVDAAVAKIEADVEAASAGVEAAISEVEFAKSGIEVAKAELAHAAAQDQLRELKAPFMGLVTGRTVDEGQLVSPGNMTKDALLVVEHVSVLRGVMTVPADEAALISVGDNVTLVGFPKNGAVQAPDGGEIKVSRVSQSLDMKTRTMRVEIDLKNPYNPNTSRYQFLSGQYGSARVKTD